MARKAISGTCVTQTTTTLAAIGAADATTAIDLVVPGPNATLRQAGFTIKTNSADTGTFGVQIMRGVAGATAISPATATTFIDADAANNTFAGAIDGGPTDGGAEGERLWIKTVKAGTVATGDVLIVNLVWIL